MTAQKEEHKTQSNKQEEKKEKVFRPQDIIKTTLIVVKELFIFSLIFYLILFIFETVFPGFVSNNFNLNWVLGVVLGLGVVAAFAPEEPKEKEAKQKPKIIDYLTAIFLGILGGALVFYKIELGFSLKLIVSAISAFLIITLSLVLLFAEDEEIEKKEEEIETFVQNTFLSRKTLIAPIAFFRLLFFKKISFPLILILLVFFFTIISLPQKQGYALRKLDFNKLSSFFKKAPSPESEVNPSPTPTPVLVKELKKQATPSAEIMIKILNGGIEKGKAEDFAKTFKEAGFKKVFFGDAERLDYKNVTLKFRPEDKEQASLIKELLKKEYSAISEAPSGTSSAEIMVILGGKEGEALEEEVTELTP